MESFCPPPTCLCWRYVGRVILNEVILYLGMVTTWARRIGIATWVSAALKPMLLNLRYTPPFHFLARSPLPDLTERGSSCAGVLLDEGVPTAWRCGNSLVLGLPTLHASVAPKYFPIPQRLVSTVCPRLNHCLEISEQSCYIKQTGYFMYANPRGRGWQIDNNPIHISKSIHNDRCTPRARGSKQHRISITQNSPGPQASIRFNKHTKKTNKSAHKRLPKFNKKKTKTPLKVKDTTIRSSRLTPLRSTQTHSHPIPHRPFLKGSLESWTC